MDRIIIQDSFQEVIEDVYNGVNDSDSFWVSRIVPGVETSQEFRINVNDESNQFHGDNGVQFNQISPDKYELKVDQDNEYLLQTPFSRFSKNLLDITAVALSPDGKLVAIGHSNGRLKVMDTWTEKVVLSIEQAHFADITSLKFFSSGKVICSGSIDMQIKLWSVEKGTNPRSMVGHTLAVTQLILLGSTGRNFLSSSTDGSVRLWECGSGSNIHTFRRVVDMNDEALSMSITKRETSTTTTTTTTNSSKELQFETKGYYVYVGYSSGNIQQYDVDDLLQTKVKFPSINGSSVTSLDVITLEEDLVIAGYLDGILRIWRDNKVWFELRVDGEDQEITKIHSSLCQSTNSLKVLVCHGDLIKLNINLQLGELIGVEYLVGMEQIKDIDLKSKVLMAGGHEGVIKYIN